MQASVSRLESLHYTQDRSLWKSVCVTVTHDDDSERIYFIVAQEPQLGGGNHSCGALISHSD